MKCDCCDNTLKVSADTDHGYVEIECLRGDGTGLPVGYRVRPDKAQELADRLVDAAMKLGSAPKLVSADNVKAWTQADDERRRLAEALRPFAGLYQLNLHKQRPDDQPVFGIDRAEITVGDLRRAVRLLDELGVG